MTFEETVRYRRSVRKYDPDKEIDTETVNIESQEELKTLLGEIKQYNSEYAYLSNSEKKYKKLITE